MTQIPGVSEKKETKYSILVKQYALTADAYKFWQTLKLTRNNLERSPLPSEVPGNIHCSNDKTEPVIGFISVGAVRQKRIFISSAHLAQTWNAPYPYECEIDSISSPDGIAQYLIPLHPSQLAIAGSKRGYYPAK